MLNGGNGVDTVDYSWHSITDTGTGEVFGVSSTPNGIADDGNFSVDEGLTGTDNVGADVENVFGSDGPDYIEGTADANRLRGAGSDDHLLGMGANDVLEGETGGDELEGGTEADILRGGDQADRLTGGSEDDLLDGGTDADTLIGQAGIDTITYADRGAAVAVTLDGLRNDGADPNADGSSSVLEEHDLDRTAENVTAGDGNDILRAPVADGIVNVLRGGLGNDTLNAREGTGTVDSLICGAGADGFAKDPADRSDWVRDRAALRPYAGALAPVLAAGPRRWRPGRGPSSRRRSPSDGTDAGSNPTLRFPRGEVRSSTWTRHGSSSSPAPQTHGARSCCSRAGCAAHARTPRSWPSRR